MATHRGGTRSLGVAHERSAGNFGRLASRTDGWLYSGNDLLRWPKGAAIVLRDARLMEPQADAGYVDTADDRLHVARRVGNSGLPRLRQVGVGYPSRLRTPRTHGSDLVCGQPRGHVRPSTRGRDVSSYPDDRITIVEAECDADVTDQVKQTCEEDPVHVPMLTLKDMNIVYATSGAGTWGQPMRLGAPGTRPDSFRVLPGGALGTIKNKRNQASQRVQVWLLAAFPRFR